MNVCKKKSILLFIDFINGIVVEIFPFETNWCTSSLTDHQAGRHRRPWKCNKVSSLRKRQSSIWSLWQRDGDLFCGHKERTHFSLTLARQWNLSSTISLCSHTVCCVNILCLTLSLVSALSLRGIACCSSIFYSLFSFSLNSSILHWGEEASYIIISLNWK